MGKYPFNTLTVQHSNSVVVIPTIVLNIGGHIIVDDMLNVGKV